MKASASTDLNNCSSLQQTSIKNFVPLGVIGHGSFSEVHKVRRISDGKIYALKKIKLHSLKPKQQEYAISEIKILAALSSPYIISFRQSFYDPVMQQLCIVMEWANQGDLQGDIERRKKMGEREGRKGHGERSRLPQSEIWRAVRDILSGLDVLHQTSILHRDIKTANIFKSEGIYKLGDLNIAKICPGLAYAYTQTGTPYYASPEVWKQLPYNTKSDIWSFGCVIYEMCELSPPFIGTDMNHLYESVIRGKFKPIDRNLYSRELAELIEGCLKIDPKERKSCREILNSKWFKVKLKQYSIKEEEKGLKGHEPQVIHQQVDQKELNIKLTKQLRELRSITEPALDPSSPLLQKCKHNVSISQYSSNKINQILPTSNYPSEIRQKKINNSECFIGEKARDCRVRPTSCRSEVSESKRNKGNQSLKEGIEKDRRQDQKENALGRLPLSESFVAEKNQNKNNQILTQNTVNGERRSKKRLLLIPPKIKGINTSLRQHEKQFARPNDSKPEQKVKIQSAKLLPVDGYHNSEEQAIEKYGQMARNAIKQSNNQANGQKKYKYKYKYKYEINGVRPSSHNPNRRQARENDSHERFQRKLVNLGPISRPASAQAQYRIRRYPEEQPRQYPKHPYRMFQPQPQTQKPQPSLLKPSPTPFPKAPTSESIHDLPKIRHILANRSSNIRQQIGKIYYNYHNASYNGYPNGGLGRAQRYFG